MPSQTPVASWASSVFENVIRTLYPDIDTGEQEDREQADEKPIEKGILPLVTKT